MNNVSEIIKPKEGQCKYTFQDGNIYIGEWKDYKRDGYGIFTYSNGNKYEGQWIDGKKNGHGIFTNKYGNKYDGQWKDDKKNGHGIFIWSNGDKYDGEWKDDIKNGYGIFVWSNGDKYEGNFKDGDRDGYGILTYTNGESYDGLWKDDKKNGLGIFIWTNGDKYDGQWINGKPKELISATIKDQKYGDCWAHSFARNFLRTLQILDVIKSDYVEQFYNLFFTILTTNKDCNAGSSYLELITLFDYLKKNYKDNIFLVKLNQSNCIEKYCFPETQENILNMNLVDKTIFIADLDYLFNNDLLFIGRYNYDVDPNGNNKPSLAIKTMLNFRLQPYVSMHVNKYVISIIHSKINSYTGNFPSIPDLVAYDTTCYDGNHAVNLRKWSVNGIEFKNSFGTTKSNDGNFSVKDLKYLICEDSINTKINTNIEFISLMFDYEKLSDNYKDRVDYKLSKYLKTFNSTLEIKKEKYEGSYNNYGLYHGNGKITNNEGTYDGEWKNGFFDGQGVFSWLNGNKYDGQWKNGIFDGQGVYTSANGDKYEGQWKDGKYQGVYTSANGDKYEGQLKDDYEIKKKYIKYKLKYLKLKNNKQ